MAVALPCEDLLFRLAVGGTGRTSCQRYRCPSFDLPSTEHPMKRPLLRIAATLALIAGFAAWIAFAQSKDSLSTEGSSKESLSKENLSKNSLSKQGATSKNGLTSTDGF